MSINVRQKGQSGEREVADMLNFIIYQVMKELGYPEEEALKGMTTVQRNQNQSAVGGNDLTNCLGLSIEVKRQEQLSVNTWWAQCEAAANRNGEVPVLMYRQNRKPWRVKTRMWVDVLGAQAQVVGEMDIESFKNWFKEWARRAIKEGAEVRT